ncbi:hypothetical protein [Pseudomonas sp. MN1F]|uniref:hypothetical protein n=1 Tax=Pseudomonas sp. MN1F TaxID=1366632 RepID=UPI00128EB126|nr:hypothetical protein [Pseudomonas sp. MN1F]MQG92024.1 hypothetical protein [Pseudomonas sp. MN1F]
MKFTPTALDDGSLQINIILSTEELAALDRSAPNPNMGTLSWGKTDYCVSCKDGSRYTIETYGDIAANIEAAATCLKTTGDPSYGLSKGSC